MKKKRLKQALAIGLVCGMTAGLCACGGGGGKNENSALAKENVYRVQDIALPEIDGDDVNVYASAHVDGEVRLLMQVYHWNDEKFNENPVTDIRLLAMKDDGSDIRMTNLDIPEWEPQAGGGAGSSMQPMPRTESQAEEGDTGEEDTAAEPEEGEDTGGEAGAEGDSAAEPESEGETGTDSEGEGGGDAEADSEGEGEGDAATDPEGDAEGEISDDAFGVEEPDYVPQDIWENSSYNNFSFGADSKIYAVRYYSYSDYANEIYTQKYYIASWNADGSFQWEKELEGLQSEDEYIYVNAMAVTAEGSATLILTGDAAYRMAVDAQGNLGSREPLSEDTGKVFNNTDRIIDKGDGTFLVIYYDENDYAKQFIATYDPATDTLGQPAPMPASYAYTGFGNMNVGINSDLVCSSGDGIYTYKIGDENLIQKMNFINSDLYVTNFSGVVEIDDSTFLGIYYEDHEEGMKAGLFTYVDPKDIPDKDVLVLAGNYVDGDMERRVIEFNRSSEKYRIAVKTYDSYNTYEDYQAGYTQLNNDVTTGNMPDILIAAGLPVENYVAKGLLEDIGKMIEEDEELSQVEFVTNVFDAYSVEGKLYYVVPSFSVGTMIGKKSIVGDKTAWTMEDMKQLQASLPEGTNMIGDLTRDDFFSTMMQFCGSDFIDVETGKCDFDTPNFIAMMEFAKSLPEEITEDYYGEDYWANYESQYRDGRTILSRLYIGNIKDTNYTINGYFGGDVAYIGFPTESGMGSYISANECFAISSKSRNKEGAWEFLRYYLTEEYQSELSWGMPVQKKYFDEMAQQGTERPFWINEDGTKEEYDDTFYMNGEEIKLDPLSQEQVDEIVAFVLSIDKCYYYNENVMNIINEEMPAFYTGQKTAQEVAKTIQNRTQLYVDENR